MSTTDLSKILNLIILMLKDHEKQLNSLTKQVQNLQFILFKAPIPLQDLPEITESDESTEIKSVLVVDDDPKL